MRLMRDAQISCLPVLQGETLVGLITERDLIRVATRLLEEHLTGAS